MGKAYFGAGCFWGIEAAFRRLKGVISTAVGYMGGERAHPTYREVCSGHTGHVETVEVDYDPEQVSYEQLLHVFWTLHDPTSLDRQGPDRGSQYRSVIFYTNPEQANAAQQAIQQLTTSGRYSRPIVTKIQPASSFYLAEEYHQRYLEKQGRGGESCHLG